MNERFFATINVPRHDPELCWAWTGFRNRDGYGRTGIGGVYKLAHRVTYEVLVGPISEGMTLDHTCRNRACVNPSHLEQVTPLENYLRGAALRTHCPNGHEYTEENTARRRNVRACRICERSRHRSYYHKRQCEVV